MLKRCPIFLFLLKVIPLSTVQIQCILYLIFTVLNLDISLEHVKLEGTLFLKDWPNGFLRKGINPVVP